MSILIYQLPHSPYCLPITRALEALRSLACRITP
jgi:hypothetical protein